MVAMAQFRPENPERALIDPGLLLVEDPEELYGSNPVPDLSESLEDAPESIPPRAPEK
jgi:hypothetical protein